MQYTTNNGREYVADNEHRDPVEVPLHAPLVQEAYALGGVDRRPAAVEIAAWALLNTDDNLDSLF